VQYRAPPPPPLRITKFPFRKCNRQYLPEKTIVAHRASCKRTAFSIAIHILSTIVELLKIMQSVVCAVCCQTQREKRVQIRRIFPVAQLSAAA
jgi:hypothetical protein